MFNNKIIFVTGGTGSFGKKFISTVINKYKPKKIIVFSRDEVKQYEMQKKTYLNKTKIEYIIGDVRDYQRLENSMQGSDFVLHAAALKQVPTAEYNPTEYIKTNINGAENIIRAAINTKVKLAMSLSTDKASNPINLYGATKLVSDKLFISANNSLSNNKTKFSVTRYGNVAGSRGSILPFFLECLDKKINYFPITDKKMTRFWITLEQSCDFVLKNFFRMLGGEIFIPKIPSIYITDLANALDKRKKHKIIGIRPGEKLSEIMFSYEDSRLVIEFDDHYVISPTIKLQKNDSGFLKNKLGQKGKKLKKLFEYNSTANKNFLSVKEIKNMNKKIT